MKTKAPKATKAVKLNPPGPLQTLILEYLAKAPSGRASAQVLAQATETTLGSVRDALNTLQKKGLVIKSPVSFELAEGPKTKGKGGK